MHAAAVRSKLGERPAQKQREQNGELKQEKQREQACEEHQHQRHLHYFCEWHLALVRLVQADRSGGQRLRCLAPVRFCLRSRTRLGERTCCR